MIEKTVERTLFFLLFNIALFFALFFSLFFVGIFAVLDQFEDSTLRSIWPYMTEWISYIYGTLWKLLTFQANWLDTNIIMVIFACLYYLVLIGFIFFPHEEE
tara:strand:+ start:44 stop:349 length:306 start_codon:yes stop_codon:yes gene_type:complete